MKTSVLLVLIVLVLEPGSFFGGKKVRSMDPWQSAKAEEGQQRQAPPERRQRKETPNVPSMRPSAEEQMMERDTAAWDANDKEWQRIERSGSQTAKKWLKADEERMEQLAEEVHKQNQAELQWLRTIAEKEQATETVKAIDQLLAAQTDRYTKIEEEFKEQRKQGREERRTRGRSRVSRSRRTDEEDRRSRSSRRSRTRERDEEESGMD